MPTRTVANSQAMANAIETARSLARTSGPILVIGGRGTGKDFFAELIHRLKHRRDFRKVDCGQSEDALRRSLLGYFDALRAEIAFDPDIEAYEPGMLDLAAEGTIYLDRIHLAPQDCIGLLVDILQGNPYRPVEMNRLLKQENIQFVASCDPHPFMDRPDGYLHSRLRVVFGERIILLPTLRDRQDDILDLIRLFAEEIAPGATLDFCSDFLQALDQYDWPGNLWDLRRMTRQILSRFPTGGRVANSIAQGILHHLSLRPTEPSEYARRARCGVLAQGLVYQNMPVHGDKLYAWIDQFTPYRGPHDVDPRDVAEELLRAIRNRYFYNNTRLRDILRKLFRQLLQEVRQSPHWRWSWKTLAKNGERALKDRMIVSNPLGPMKSPDAVHLIFRSVSGLSPRRNAVEFDKLPQRIHEEANGLIIVFLDDFIGSGGQFEREVLGKKVLSNNELRKAIQVRKGSPVHIFMLVCVAYEEGLTRATKALRTAPQWLKMSILVGDVLCSESKAFSPKSVVFPNETTRSKAEEIIVQRIGQHLYPNAPRGWGNMQSLVVFEHNTPNSTLPIIWKDGYVGERLWKAIFPRMRAG